MARPRYSSLLAARLQESDDLTCFAACRWPTWTLELKNIHRSLHGSDTGIYDRDVSSIYCCHKQCAMYASILAIADTHMQLYVHFASCCMLLL
jgi:hypothetical protein